MPRVATQLNDKQVKSIVSIGRIGLHAVGGISGLNIQVQDNGKQRSASWILRVTINGQRRLLGLGGYPSTSLSTARKNAEKILFGIKFEGMNPFELKEQARIAALEQEAEQAKLKTFKQVAKLFINKKEQEYKTKKQVQKLTGILENYAYPHIGDLLIKDIEITHIVDLLKEIWTDKHETANRARMYISGVFDIAIADGTYKDLNPARWKGGLEHFLPKPSKTHTTKNQEALPVEQMPALMKLIREDDNITSRLTSFIILTTCRSIEGSKAKWSDIDLKHKIWTIPESGMKSNREHRVPLSQQCIEILEALPRECELVFPNFNGKPFSHTSILKSHQKHGLTGTNGEKPTTHGFRSTFKDWARKMTAYRDELSEIQLAHKFGNETRSAYARDDLLEQRRKLIQDWANYIYFGKEVGGENVRAIRA